MKQKKPLVRRTPLKSSSGPAKRGTRVKRAVWWLKDLFSYRDGVQREKEIEARENVYGAKAAWICGKRCFVCRKQGWVQIRPTVPAHAVKTRGAGGDNKTLVPLCADHEEQWHWMGRDTFATTFNVDLSAVAEMYEADWQLWQSTNNKGSEE
jgi:hypothetical protein